MGRHGGGSRSGGSSRRSSGRSRSGSRSGGKSIRTSSKPFAGCYDRSYYDRRGRYRAFYTSDARCGKSVYGIFSGMFTLFFVTLHMLVMCGSLLISSITLGYPVNGDVRRIYINDTVDLLTVDEEEDLLKLFQEVYDKSGIPVTLYTDDFEWKQYYNSIEVYSEELYYTVGMDEDALIFLFTADTVDGFFDWEYDVYCGDDTIHCFSDNTFDKLLSTFHKSMAKQDLYVGLTTAWNSIMDDLASTEVNWFMLPILLIVLSVYGLFYVVTIRGMLRTYSVYKYFKENPDKLSDSPVILYNRCPSCGASNSTQSTTCPYCDTLLKVSDNNVKYVEPK